MYAAWLVALALLTASVAGCATAGDPPDRINYCDRDYHRGSLALSAAEAAAQSTQSSEWTLTPFVEVGHTSAGRPFFARVTTERDRHRFLGPVLPCTMLVFLRLDDGRFLAYDLEGGP